MFADLKYDERAWWNVVLHAKGISIDGVMYYYRANEEGFNRAKSDFNSLSETIRAGTQQHLEEFAREFVKKRLTV